MKMYENVLKLGRGKCYDGSIDFVNHDIFALDVPLFDVSTVNVHFPIPKHNMQLMRAIH